MLVKNKIFLFYNVRNENTLTPNNSDKKFCFSGNNILLVAMGSYSEPSRQIELINLNSPESKCEEIPDFPLDIGAGNKSLISTKIRTPIFLYLSIWTDSKLVCMDSPLCRSTTISVVELQ